MTQPSVELRDHDMYGNHITPLGETGYGVSVAFGQTGGDGNPVCPQFTFFHMSDGFRQCLFTIVLNGPSLPSIYNVFQDRVAEVYAGLPTNFGAFG